MYLGIIIIVTIIILYIFPKKHSFNGFLEKNKKFMINSCDSKNKKYNDYIEYSIKVSDNYINNTRVIFGYFNYSFFDLNLKNKYFDRIIDILRINKLDPKFEKFFIDNKNLIENQYLGYTIIGRDFLENVEKLYLEFRIGSTTMIKCIEKHNDKIVYKFYKNYNENILEILNYLLFKCNDIDKVTKILDLFGNYDENVYRCYTSETDQFNKLDLNSVHIRIFSHIKKVFPLIKNLYLIINQNISDYKKFANTLNKDLYVNFISISFKNGKISFSIYGNKRFV